MKKPNFFIIGAPKCGTTSLAAWLSEHPQVYFSPIKEPFFFNTDHRIMGRFSPGDYEKLFRKAGAGHLAVGEGTAVYLLSLDAVPNILDYAESPRFIVCVRNPIEMAVSLHQHHLRYASDNITDFEVAWRLQPERKNGNYLPMSIWDPKFLMYGNVCRLGEQVDRLYGHVDTDSVLVLLLEDVKDNPRREYLRVLGFLGLDDDGRQNFSAHNVAKKLHPIVSKFILCVDWAKRVLRVRRGFGLLTRLSNLAGRPHKHPELSPQLLKDMRDYFREDVERLGALLNRELSHWLDMDRKSVSSIHRENNRAI